LYNNFNDDYETPTIYGSHVAASESMDVDMEWFIETFSEPVPAPAPVNQRQGKIVKGVGAQAPVNKGVTCIAKIFYTEFEALCYYAYHTCGDVTFAWWYDGTAHYPCLVMWRNISFLNDMFNATKHVLPVEIHQSKELPLCVSPMEPPQSSRDDLKVIFGEEFRPFLERDQPMDDILIYGRRQCNALVVVFTGNTTERRSVVVDQNGHYRLKVGKSVGSRVVKDEVSGIYFPV